MLRNYFEQKLQLRFFWLVAAISQSQRILFVFHLCSSITFLLVGWSNPTNPETFGWLQQSHKSRDFWLVAAIPQSQRLLFVFHLCSYLFDIRCFEFISKSKRVNWSWKHYCVSIFIQVKMKAITVNALIIHIVSKDESYYRKCIEYYMVSKHESYHRKCIDYSYGK